MAGTHGQGKNDVEEPAATTSTTNPRRHNTLRTGTESDLRRAEEDSTAVARMPQKLNQPSRPQPDRYSSKLHTQVRYSTGYKKSCTVTGKDW